MPLRNLDPSDPDPHFTIAVKALARAVREAAREVYREEAANPTEPRLLLRAEQAAQQLSISRSAVYQLLARKELDSVKMGKRRLIKATSLAEYVERLEDD